MLAELEREFTVERVLSIPPERAITYFVAAQFLPGGIEMELYRVVTRSEPQP